MEAFQAARRPRPLNQRKLLQNDRGATTLHRVSVANTAATSHPPLDDSRNIRIQNGLRAENDMKRHQEGIGTRLEDRMLRPNTNLPLDFVQLPNSSVKQPESSPPEISAGNPRQAAPHIPPTAILAEPPFQARIDRFAILAIPFRSSEAIFFGRSTQPIISQSLKD
jgi:hypothetical protein